MFSLCVLALFSSVLLLLVSIAIRAADQLANLLFARARTLSLLGFGILDALPDMGHLHPSQAGGLLQMAHAFVGDGVIATHRAVVFGGALEFCTQCIL